MSLELNGVEASEFIVAEYGKERELGGENNTSCVI
jgi:hypothetical protein